MKKTFRPELHFSPKIGWMNDPNGFSFDSKNGVYTLFYQHHNALSGDVLIDWGKATSKDLINFHDFGASLIPSSSFEGVGIKPLWGGCWSGTYIKENEDEYLLYTACSINGEYLAFARPYHSYYFLDSAINLISPPPFVPKEYFRDPFAFSYEEKNYVLVGAQVGKVGSILLYERNGTSLSYMGIFYQEEGTYMLECPSLIFLEGECFLFFSPMGLNKEKWGLHPNLMRKGKIDEHLKFVSTSSLTSLDYGYDFYAALPCQIDEKCAAMIGWNCLWDKDLGSIPSKEEGYIGTMGLPRKLTLKNGDFCQEIMPSFYENLKKEGDFDGDFFEIDDHQFLYLHFSSYKDFTCSFFKNQKEEFLLSYDERSMVLTMDAHGSLYEKEGINLTYPGERCVKVLPQEEIEIIVDHSVIEVVLGKGRVWMTSLFYPKNECYIHQVKGSSLKFSYFSIKK